MRKKKFFKRFLYATLIVFLVMNVVAYFHAYKFTHFDPEGKIKTKNAKELSFLEKAEALFFGVSNPRPENKKLPDGKYEVLKLKSNKEIECWYIKADSSKGTIAIFHGFAGEKSGMLDKAEVFRQMGYNTLLVDFMGAGGSEGNICTIGYFEAEQVKTCFNYLKEKGEDTVILFGTSMGAAAVMKAVSDTLLKPSSVILECPFGSMLQTVEARFRSMDAPCFPMARLLVFWGGFQNDFDAFEHNPIEYAKKISCPVLLMYGGKDETVTVEESEGIFNNLKGLKKKVIFPEAGHENYLKNYTEEWTGRVKEFLSGLEQDKRVP